MYHERFRRELPAFRILLASFQVPLSLLLLPLRTFALASCCVFSLLTPAFGQSSDNSIELFDGESLNGWEGDPAHWRVEDGVIVGEIPKGQSLDKNTWLVWKDGELADFDLQLQFRLTGLPTANSGIQFRCQVDNVDHVSGYQADLDMGATWLGRIYDEHARALLVERGSRVRISATGQRHVETFAPANPYAVLFRENAWNDYRIAAIGDHIAVYVNGTLFSELQDLQNGEQDLQGSLAFQLHSGPETRIEFREIRLQRLTNDSGLLADFSIKPQIQPDAKTAGIVPAGADGSPLNPGFESGDLKGWTSTGDAFRNQPVKDDGIPSRWPGQISNKDGHFFIGGYEFVQDSGTGTLTSSMFKTTHPYASFLIGGGEELSTRVELVQLAEDGTEESVIFTAGGKNQEQMRRVTIDLRKLKDISVVVRLVDENSSGWGHLNFDDFRFHDEPPTSVEGTTVWRSAANPVLQHLIPNTVTTDSAERGTETAAQMFVPPGFSVDVVIAEPQLHQPMAFTFDARGRLWVVEGHSYPQKRPEGEGLDRVLIFSDSDGDGRFEDRRLFAEGLNLVSGLEVGHGGVWIGAAPQLLFIPDKDGNDQPDSEPQVLLDGFGYADTHETLNSFMWGPDGWLYGNQGVFNSSMIGKPGALDHQRQALSAGVWRYHPTKHTFEVFAHGGSNQWGLDYDDFGQIFMTHCRSFWGKGSTTHVIQGGHFWNQVNSGHAPFISAVALPNLPAMKNFLLASARYDHGEGGAGKPGTDEVYGGHSHVGTMIYLGDNWPPEYRNHLFTHNLHGHQINHQINVREGGGYNTVHAGTDVLFCADRQYIGVDLQCGPDGAVYISDWYDPRHCHNPDTEQWDRGNGRLYRMKYHSTWEPVVVDYSSATDDALVDAQLYVNDWHVRTARLVLSERAARGTVSASAIQRLKSIAIEHKDTARRLRAVWALHGIGQLDGELIKKLFVDESEYVRAWTVQLAVESLPADAIAELLNGLAVNDESLFVQRYIASAIQRVPAELGWFLAERLSAREDTASDRELPQLLWYGIAQLLPHDLDRAFRLADTTSVPVLRDYILWYAAKLSPEGRATVVERLAKAEGDEQIRLLNLLDLAVRDMRGLPAPQAWPNLAEVFYDATQTDIRHPAESIGAAFGDERLYARMRRLLDDQVNDVATKRHAIAILASDASPENLSRFLKLLDTPELAPQIIPLLSRFNDDSVPEQLIQRLPNLQGNDNGTAMEVLCSRVTWADRVLDAITTGTLPKHQLTAYSARQMASLGNSPLNARLSKEWGMLGQTSEELRAEIETVATAYSTAPLWAYDANAGSLHFKKLCAQCHLPNQQNESLAPRLAGSGAKGVAYVAENIINPNAVIGRDYQARIVVTTEGRVLTGLIEKETDSSITVRTLTGSETVAKSDIEETTTSTNSFMPEGLLKTLNDRERIELFKYLMAQ